MERRKRVEMMMNSRLFREELERIIETQMKDGGGPTGLLQQISEMMGIQGVRFNNNMFKSKYKLLYFSTKNIDKMNKQNLYFKTYSQIQTVLFQ